jgi:peptide/nickel transport system substrate-binding protein
VGAVALGTAGCSGDRRFTGDVEHILTIHLADRDERALGPMGAYPWFLVFLGIADGFDSAEAVPELIDRWDHSPDYSEWTLHVREGVVWNDGAPVTAEDIKFSLELWTASNIGYEARHFDTVTVLDSHTLRVGMKQPVASTPFVYTWLPVVPKHVLDTLDTSDFFSWPFWIQPVGNGPYRYSRHIPATMTELRANPDYHGEPPRIATVVLRYGGNALTELLSGNVDVATGLAPIEIVRLRRDSRFTIYYSLGIPTVRAIAWNHRNPLFQEARVRRALTMAIDRQALLKVLEYPEEVPIVDVPALPRHYRQGVVPSPLPFAPDSALSLLAEAGWYDVDDDGILEKDGREFRFTLAVSENESAQAVFIQEQLRRVGVEAEVDVYDTSAWRQRARIGGFDATIWPYGYINHFSDFAISGYRNAEISALRDSAWYTIDRAVHDRYMQDFWRQFAREMPITYLHPLVRYEVAWRRVKGLENGMDFVRNVEHLWIEEE